MALSCVVAAFVGASASWVSPPLAPRTAPELLVSCRARPIVAAAAAAFSELFVGEDMFAALSELGVTKPNELQTRAIPAIAGRENLIIGAQTGSGKTLTYLVPVMEAIKSDEEAGHARAKPKRPRAIVLVPTRELALQVHDVAKSLSHHVKLSVSIIHGGVPDAPQLKRLQQPTDVLVATPGRLVKLLDLGGLYLGDVRHVVLDEVDTMFEAGFGPELDKILGITTRDLSSDQRAQALLGAAGGATPQVQHLAVGATHPEGALLLYKKWLSSARAMMLEGSHTLPPQLRQNFLTCNGPTAKVTALRDLLGIVEDGGKPSLGRVVLFCNSQQSARFVDHTLSEEGYATANYHGAVPANERAANYARFVAGDAHVLVTTDLAARGLDKLDVQHVVQFDFAKSAADYVHRCGRTARAGKSGAVTSLVTKSDLELVRAIRAAEKKGGDVIAAGEAQQKLQRQQRATELQVTSLVSGGPGAGAAAFPEVRGLSGNRPPEGGGGGGRGRRRSRGGGKRSGSGAPAGRGRARGAPSRSQRAA